MELIVICDTRLKIMLTGEDMAHYDLGDPCKEEVSPHTREALRHILTDARAEIGFDTEGDRLLVQLYASKGGGCEIFVTKLEDTGEARLIKRIQGEVSDVGQKRTVWMRIETLEDLTALCRRLKAGGYRGESCLYISEGRESLWYVSLTVHELWDGTVDHPYLWEYGTEVKEEISLYLAEYGRGICTDNAVERLSEL